jgi:hypothetical protein
MANISIWTGNSTFYPGDTPFGFYDNDYQFQLDADKVARFCAQRLGYPLVDIELQSGSFYTAFEEAVTVYGNELYSIQLRDNYLSLEGASTSSYLNQSLVTPNLGSIIRISQQYASEAGTGGSFDWFSGSIYLTSSQQDYDLKQWAIDNNITGGIEIKKVFYEQIPAINQLYSPWAGLAPGATSAVGLAGLAGFGPATSFLLMPTSFDIANIQAIEMSNQIRMSNYTFQLINNKLRIFPIPGGGDEGVQVWFNYIKIEDRTNSAIQLSPGTITNLSKAPYGNPTYSQVNSIGRMWIFEYALALSKEMLGYVRGKYSTVPIPNSEVTLNSGDLISAATSEKEALKAKLRDYLDTTSRQSLLERKSAETLARNTEISQVPMTIYIA